MMRSEQAGFANRRALSVADETKKVRETQSREISRALHTQFKAAATRRREALSKKTAQCAVNATRQRKIGQYFSAEATRKRAALELRLEAVAARKREALAKKTAQCAVNKMRHGKIVYYFAAEERARHNAARRCIERVVRASLKQRQLLDGIRDERARHHTKIANSVAGLALTAECSNLRRQNTLATRFARAELQRASHIAKRAEHASRESARFAASYSQSIESANSRRAALATLVAEKAHDAAQRRTDGLNARAEACGAHVRRAKAIARDVANAFSKSRVACKEFINAKLKLADLRRRDTVRANAAAEHCRRVRSVVVAVRERNARVVEKMRRRLQYKARRASEQREGRLQAESIRNGAEVQRARCLVDSHKKACSLAALQAKEALEEKTARAAARHSASPTAHRSAKAKAHVQHVKEVTEKLKTESELQKEQIKQTLMLKSNAASARRAAMLQKSAVKSGLHAQHVQEVAKKLKTESEVQKTTVARKLEFKFEAASARREEKLRELSSKNGAYVKAALEKALSWKKHTENQRNEKKLRAQQRQARANARKVQFLQRRSQHAAPRMINNRRRARQARTC